MSTSRKRSLLIRQADIVRAVKGATQGGLAVGRVEIDPSTGRIVVLAAAISRASDDPLDQWMEKRRAGSA